jgi:hypothetical protein
MGMKVGAGKAPPQPEAPVEQPPVGGSPKAPEAKHKGDLGGSGILAGLGIAAGVILATLGVSHMLNRPAAKMPTPRTSITSSSLTTVEATSTTTTIPPTTEAGGGVEKPPRIEPPKEEPPDLKKKSIDIIKSAEKLPFKDALLTLRRYALNSKGSWESKDSFFDAMQELVDTYNQKNADACRKAMQNLGSRWTRISTEELGGARGIPGTDSQTKPLPREPNQMPNAIIIEQIKPYVDALGKSR